MAMNPRQLMALIAAQGGGQTIDPISGMPATGGPPILDPSMMGMPPTMPGGGMQLPPEIMDLATMGGSPEVNPEMTPPPFAEDPEDESFKPTNKQRWGAAIPGIAALLGALTVGKKKGGSGFSNLMAGFGQSSLDHQSSKMRQAETKFLKDQDRDLQSAHEYALKLQGLQLKDPPNEPGKFQALRSWIQKYNEGRASGKGLSHAEAKKLFIEMGRHSGALQEATLEQELGSKEALARREFGVKSDIEKEQFFEAHGVPASGEGVGLNQWRQVMQDYGQFRQSQLEAKVPVPAPWGGVMYVNPDKIYGGETSRDVANIRSKTVLEKTDRDNRVREMVARIRAAKQTGKKPKTDQEIFLDIMIKGASSGMYDPSDDASREAYKADAMRIIEESKAMAPPPNFSGTPTPADSSDPYKLF